MADFLGDVADYLEAQGIGTWTSDSGRNIFRGVVPDEPANCVVVLGAPRSGETPSVDVAALLYPRFSVFIRNTDYELGSTKAAAVRAALHVKIGISFDNFRVLRCHADTEVEPLGQDSDTGRYEWICNFTAEAHAT